MPHVGELVGELAQPTCPDCGIKFMEFRAGGRLGCPDDYEAFARGLVPLLATDPRRHAGTSARSPPTPAGRRGRPAPAPGPAPRGRRREDYEEAARLRDQLRQKEADG